LATGETEWGRHLLPGLPLRRSHRLYLCANLTLKARQSFSQTRIFGFQLLLPVVLFKPDPGPMKVLYAPLGIVQPSGVAIEDIRVPFGIVVTGLVAGEGVVANQVWRSLHFLFFTWHEVVMHPVTTS
jgi:hypothetical protein